MDILILLRIWKYNKSVQVFIDGKHIKKSEVIYCQFANWDEVAVAIINASGYKGIKDLNLYNFEAIDICKDINVHLEYINVKNKSDL